MSNNYENDENTSNNSRGPSATRRAVLQVGAGGLGVLGLLDLVDNGKLDGSLLSPGSTGSRDDFLGGDADNDGDLDFQDSPTASPTEVYTEPTETQPTETEQPLDTPTATASDPSDLPASCDRMYIKEDGTVVGLDIEDREYRVFSPGDFPNNTELSGLYDELEPSRGLTELPGGLGEGVRSSRAELFQYSVEAYDDMADEAEWDVIWDKPSRSSCTY